MRFSNYGLTGLSCGLNLSKTLNKQNGFEEISFRRYRATIVSGIRLPTSSLSPAIVEAADEKREQNEAQPSRVCRRRRQLCKRRAHISDRFSEKAESVDTVAFALEGQGSAVGRAIGRFAGVYRSNNRLNNRASAAVSRTAWV